MSPRTEKGSAPPPPEHLWGNSGLWCTHYTMRLRVVPCSDGEPWIVLICSQAVQMICALPQLILSSRKSSRSSAVLDGSSCRVAARTAQQAAKQVAEGAAPPLAVAAAKRR